MRRVSLTQHLYKSPDYFQPVDPIDCPFALGGGAQETAVGMRKVFANAVPRPASVSDAPLGP